jgi:hypothetical protein
MVSVTNQEIDDVRAEYLLRLMLQMVCIQIHVKKHPHDFVRELVVGIQVEYVVL